MTDTHDQPWLTETSHCEWTDPQTGYACLILRGPLQTLCGYVALPPDHVWHGESYDTLDLEVHGGLTYSGACSGDICHTPAAGEPDNVWWLGFDCAHAGDYVPGYERIMLMEGEYRDLVFVREECRRLAAQLREAQVVEENAAEAAWERRMNDGETFRGGEAAAAEAEQQAWIQRNLK